MASCLIPCKMTPFKMGSTLKGKNLLRSKFFSLRVTPNEMGGKNENKRVASPESVPIHLMIPFCRMWLI